MRRMTDTESQLRELADKTGQSIDELRQQFAEARATVEERLVEDVSDDQLDKMALGTMNAERIHDERTGVSGDPMDLEILSIGHRGVWEGMNLSGDEDDTVLAHGVIQGPLRDDGQKKAAIGIIFARDQHVDLADVQRKFRPRATLTGHFEVEEAWSASDGFYRVYTSDQTEIERTEIDDLPDDDAGKNTLLRKMFPDVKLADLLDHNGSMSSYDADSDEKYTDDYGVDVKRFQGTIVDHYINDDRTWGVYTIMDQSADEEDVEGSRLHGERQNMPGLEVHCVPDAHMEFGRGSIVDVYGVLEFDSDGKRPIMRAAGIVPVAPEPIEADSQPADQDVDSKKEAI